MAHLPELSNFTELTMFLSATFASQIRRQGHFESFCQSPHCGAYNTIVMKAKPRDPANIRDALGVQYRDMLYSMLGYVIIEVGDT